MEVLNFTKKPLARAATTDAQATPVRSNRLLVASVIANAVTIAVAALGIVIVSASDRRTAHAQARELQELEATVDSLRQSLNQALFVTPPPVSTSAGASVISPKPAAAAPPGSRSHKGEPLPKMEATAGPTVLQVAALPSAADALALATELQKKGFPAFVLEPQTDQYYRVQLGAYADDALAKVARQQLKNQGLESIIKHRPAKTAR
jgi:cell division septation protein DedD